MARRPQTRTELADTIYDLTPGDHIATPGRVNVYQHHAIVLEVDLSRRRVTVINYDWDEKGSSTLARILKSHYSFDETDIYKIIYPGGVVLYAEEVIKRAKMHVGETGGFQLGKYFYNLLTNNCEHFATWCKTGSAFCLQLPTEKEQKKIAAGAMIGAPAGALLGGIFATMMTEQDEETEGEKTRNSHGAKAAGLMIGGLLGAVVGGMAGLAIKESDDEDETRAYAIKQKEY